MHASQTVICIAHFQERCLLNTMKIKILLTLFFFLPLFCISQELYFPPIANSNWDTISPQSVGWCEEKIELLYDYLEIENTKAFILLQDGKIVLEKYFGAHTQTTPWYWASAGKTITAFMTGIAQQENYLSISDKTANYLGQGWTSCTPDQEEKITIWHHLTMTSGLDDDVPDNSCTQDTCLIYKEDAGSRWSYHNAPYTLLDKVIENATGITLNNYTAQKLKNTTGMTGSFFMVGNNNVFFSNARTMARFGLLILNKGVWNGNQIMTDTTYFSQMVNTSQSLNEAYGYLWWLNGKSSYMAPGFEFVISGNLFPNAPHDMISALGLNGQILNVIPSQNMVLLRMGESPGNVPVPFLMNDKIWEYINNLKCAETFAEGRIVPESDVSMYPNPSGSLLTIKSHSIILGIEFFNFQGQLLKEINMPFDEIIIKMDFLKPGVYFIKIRLLSGEIVTKKLVKE
jgi:CubicO group peptidase (beta-lactamase class C family)